jgi:adenylate cyclase class 2
MSINIEYEATFANVNKDDIRQRLKEAGAILVKPENLMTRSNFELPSGHEIKGGWLRVRNENDKITMSLKVVDGDKIEDQKEICLKIDNFAEGVKFLESIGCELKAYQESKRELWLLDDVEITIDEWPYLEPYVEVEGKSEQAVKDVSAKLNFDYNQALFCAVDILYANKYKIDTNYINHTKRICFNEPNPFE